MDYKTRVRPLVEYSSSGWSPNTDKYIGKIEMVQRKAARWTLDIFSQASATEMLTQLGLRSLEQRRKGVQGFWGSGEKGYLFSGSWGALLIILGKLGNKQILLGI